MRPLVTQTTSSGISPIIASRRALVEGDGDEDSAKERALAAIAAAEAEEPRWYPGEGDDTDYDDESAQLSAIKLLFAKRMARANALALESYNGDNGDNNDDDAAVEAANAAKQRITAAIAAAIAAEEHLCRPYSPINKEEVEQGLKRDSARYWETVRAENALAREQFLARWGPAPETTSSSAVQLAVAYSHIFPLEPAPAPATSSSGLPRIATSAPTRPLAAGPATKQTSSGINRIIASARALVDKEIDDDVSTITCD